MACMYRLYVSGYSGSQIYQDFYGLHVVSSAAVVVLAAAAATAAAAAVVVVQ